MADVVHQKAFIKDTIGELKYSVLVGVGGGVFKRDKVCSATQVTPSMKKKILTKNGKTFKS